MTYLESQLVTLNLFCLLGSIVQLIKSVTKKSHLLVFQMIKKNFDLRVECKKYKHLK